MTSPTLDTPAARPPAGLIVVTIDRLPAWILPAYGATWVAMPRLDALAARGVVFDRVITPSTDPRRTLGDLAGDDATPREPSGTTRFSDTPLAAAALAAGWRMAVVTDDATVAGVGRRGDASETGAAGGTFAVRFVAPGPAGRMAKTAEETAVARLVDAAVEAVAAGHRLLWCHVSSLGMVWDAPPAYRERYVDPEDPPPPAGGRVPSLAVDADTDPDLVVGYRQVFAGQLTLLDEQIGRLIDSLPEPHGSGGQGGGWGVVVAGVRGLPLGIHGWIGTGGPAVPYGELVHVPAILVDPSGRMAGQRYGGLAVPADLGATLLGWVAGRPQADPTAAAPPWAGRSLAGLFHDWSAKARDRVVVASEGGGGIVTRSWHALAAGSPGPGGDVGRPRLFAKPDDFFEIADVADRCGDVAEGLASLLRPSPEKPAHRAWLDPLPGGSPDAGDPGPKA